jgi:ADP-dependent NAD(P)H-hydrate dehydratase / NAD(P)H-hydrate epimerase
VAAAAESLPVIASSSPELMTEPLQETADGAVSYQAKSSVEGLLKAKAVLAIGPGLGRNPETVTLVRELFRSATLPMVVDADALIALAETDLQASEIRIFTPHPGEMSRLVGKSVKDVQAARLETAQELSAKTGVTVVLKGDRTVIAFPDGDCWINPTGSPSMATGGTGDILTGLVAGLVAQFPQEWKLAVVAAVWLHGRAGELGARHLGEQSLIAGDLLTFLPEAMAECRAAL